MGDNSKEGMLILIPLAVTDASIVWWISFEKNFCLFEIQALPIIALLYKCTGLGGHKCTVGVRPETQMLIV